MIEDNEKKLFESEVMIGDELGHAEILKNVAWESTARGLNDIFIVDVDFHHTDNQVWGEIIEYVPNEVLRNELKTGSDGSWYMPGEVDRSSIQEVQSRIQPQSSWDHAHPEMKGADREVARCIEMMDAMGTNYASLFPTFLLDVGVFPFREMEAPITYAWARWVTERILPQDSRIVTQLSLPFGDPDACLKMVEDFGDHPGVIGFMITSVRYDPTYKKEYMKLYRALEERGLPLAFHSAYNYNDRHTGQFNKFISIHTLGFPMYNMVQATNWIVNGLPERFPDLKVLFIEGGLAWLPFLMQRLDAEFIMRPSEAPLLQRRPSEYMREFYYSTQPLEAVHLPLLEETFNMVNAETQLCYASDWPHWDWDPPHKIWDIPFLSEQGKRNVLGENARRLFNLPMNEAPKNSGPSAGVKAPTDVPMEGNND